MSPHEARYAWPDKERRVVAVYIKQAYGLKATAPAILKFLPVSIERWGKFRVKGERNVVRSDWAAGRISTDRLRDSSYVRVRTHSLYSHTNPNPLLFPSCLYSTSY